MLLFVSVPCFLMRTLVIWIFIPVYELSSALFQHVGDNMPSCVFLVFLVLGNC